MSHLLHEQEARRIAGTITNFEWYGGDHDITQIYEVVEFSQYPMTRGWSTSTEDGLLTELKSNPVAAIAMLQSWQLFGTLEAVTRVNFRSADWLMEKDGSTVVDARKWLSLGSDWDSRYTNDMDLAIRQKIFQTTLNQVQNRCMFLTHVLDQPEDFGFTECNDLMAKVEDIVCLTIMLADMLMHTAPVNLTFGQGFVAFATRFSNHMEDAISLRFRQNGWCPSTPDLLQHIGGTLSFVEFGSLFSSTDRTGDHANCSNKTCVAHNVDVSDAKAKHVSATCNCDSISPVVQDVMRILLNTDTFPVVNLLFLWLFAQLPADNHWIPMLRRLTVVEYHPRLEFMAISHVWSDGLRGTTEVGLPFCQVDRLYKYSLLTGKHLIWLDILCVPGDRQARQNAIRRMRNVYLSATTTLVLDAGLLRCNMSNVSVREIILRIITSTWEHRLWTLQECLLSSNLVFMLSEGCISLRSLHRKMERISSRDPITTPMFRKIREIASYREQESKHLHLQLARVAPMLNVRETSRHSDETLAIAPLLGIDAGAIVQEDPTGEARMMKFWHLLANIPLDLPMLETPKMISIGYRALPRTMMSSTPDYPLYTWSNMPSGRMTERGLEGNYFVISLPSLQVADNFDKAMWVNVVSSGVLIRLTLRGFSEAVRKLQFDTLIMLQDPAKMKKWCTFVMKGAILCSSKDSEQGVPRNDMPIYEFVSPVEVFDYSEYVWRTHKPEQILTDGGQSEIIIT